VLVKIVMRLGREQEEFFNNWKTSNEIQVQQLVFNSMLDIGCSMFGCSMLDVFPFLKTISPCPTFRSSRDKWGMGVCQALFPMLTLGAPLSGAVSFPTPFSTASGVFGLVAGPSSALRPLDFE
jgi:hypothetical protein